MNTAKSILVVVESGETGIKPFSFEVISAARILADSLGGTVDALCLGIEKAQADSLVHWGADYVKILENPLFKVVTLEQALLAIEPLVNSEKPYAVLFSATTHGKELSACLSAKLNVGLATDCIAIEVGEQGEIMVRRPVYAGKALSHLILQGSGPHILSLRQNVFRGSSPDTSRTGKVELLDLKIPDDQLVLKIQDVVRETGSQLDVTEARVIVSLTTS
jgi:electron transfer flavoprotein alpha subunit